MSKLSVSVFRPVLYILSVLLAAVCGAAGAGDAPTVRITYLYDNTAAVAGTRPAWGFAALVEAYGKRVLFDTGGDAAVFRENVAALGVDLGQLDALVLSHEHWDHTNGTAALGQRDGLLVFYPASASASAPFMNVLKSTGMKLSPVREMTNIAPRIFVSNEMQRVGPHEVALVVDTDDGLVILVGCAHPGPEVMLAQIRERTGRPILMLVGGFHLLNSGPEAVSRTLAEFKTLGVRYVGPTHCTGDAAIPAARQAFGEAFVEGGVGTVVEAAPFARRTVR
jgi:7,8-dihydropterin-6-yl-methyl-4-(beta-D-ribofuranosyl)aminobenzene 5'-phosphate synthase